MNGTPGAEETTLRQTAISISNPTYPDPYGGRSPASFASTAPPNISHRRRQHGEPLGGHGEPRRIAAARRRHGDQRGRRQHEVERVQRQRTHQHAGQRRAPASRVGRINQVQSIGGKKYRAMLVRLEKRLSSRYQYTVLSYTLQKVQDNLVRRDLHRNDHRLHHPEYDQGMATPIAVTRWSQAARICCPAT